MDIKIAIMNRLMGLAESLVLRDDKRSILRTQNIELIPSSAERTGGKKSYAEWAHVIGIFQTLLNMELGSTKDNRVLDIGCGTGLLAIASIPFVESGKYLGMDVIKKDIEFCKSHYDLPNFSFEHFDVFNATYALEQMRKQKLWNVVAGDYDVVTAISVWTHMDERDAIFYFSENSRALRKGGKAIVTFFYLDDKYRNTATSQFGDKSKYHNTNLDWRFEIPVKESANWFTTRWSKNPEDAIGINESGIKQLMEASGLKIIKYYPGNWKELPGVYFQDILIFEK